MEITDFKDVDILRAMIFLFLLNFGGCVTSKLEYTETNELPKDKVYRISEIYMKDGSTLYVKAKDAKLRLKYKGMENAIVYYNDINVEKFVLLKDVSRLKIEIIESNTVVNVLIIVGSIIALLLLLLMIYPPNLSPG